MPLTRWTNPSLPQTLQIAVFLFYIDAAFAVVSGTIANPIIALLAGGGVAAGLGIANGMRWGYMLAVAVTGLGVALLALHVAASGIGTVFAPQFLLFALIPIAMFIAVIHPASREHQRIWFS